MAKKGHSEEEILRVLREAESGMTVVEVCRKHGISQQSFYLWKRKYAGLGLSELRELRNRPLRPGQRGFHLAHRLFVRQSVGNKLILAVLVLAVRHTSGLAINTNKLRAQLRLGRCLQCARIHHGTEDARDRNSHGPRCRARQRPSPDHRRRPAPCSHRNDNRATRQPGAWAGI